METTPSTDIQHFISFSLAREFFAIDVRHVAQVLQATTFTRVPQAPTFLKGVTNFNGNVIPVVDTYIRFGFPVKEGLTQQLVIVLSILLDGTNTNIGITVDDSDEVFEIGTQEITPYPVTGNKYKADYIEGVIHRKGKFMLVLNVEKLFGKDELDDFISNREQNK